MTQALTLKTKTMNLGLLLLLRKKLITCTLAVSLARGDRGRPARAWQGREGGGSMASHQYQNRIGTYISNIHPKMRCTSEIGTYVRNWDRPRPPWLEKMVEINGWSDFFPNIIALCEGAERQHGIALFRIHNRKARVVHHHLFQCPWSYH